MRISPIVSNYSGVQKNNYVQKKYVSKFPHQESNLNLNSGQNINFTGNYTRWLKALIGSDDALIEIAAEIAAKKAILNNVSKKANDFVDIIEPLIKTVTSANGNIKTISHYQESNAGNKLISKLEETFDGSFIAKTKYKYVKNSKANHLAETYNYDKNENLLWTTKYKYNDKNQIVETTNIDALDKLMHQTNYEYNETSGRLRRTLDKNAHGDNIKIVSYYDKDGSPVKTIEIFGGKLHDSNNSFHNDKPINSDYNFNIFNKVLKNDENFRNNTYAWKDLVAETLEYNENGKLVSIEKMYYTARLSDYRAKLFLNNDGSLKDFSIFNNGDVFNYRSNGTLDFKQRFRGYDSGGGEASRTYYHNDGKTVKEDYIFVREYGDNKKVLVEKNDEFGNLMYTKKFNSQYDGYPNTITYTTETHYYPNGKGIKSVKETNSKNSSVEETLYSINGNVTELNFYGKHQDELNEFKTSKLQSVIFDEKTGELKSILVFDKDGNIKNSYNEFNYPKEYRYSSYSQNPIEDIYRRYKYRNDKDWRPYGYGSSPYWEKNSR